MHQTTALIRCFSENKEFLHCVLHYHQTESINPQNHGRILQWTRNKQEIREDASKFLAKISIFWGLGKTLQSAITSSDTVHRSNKTRIFLKYVLSVSKLHLIQYTFGSSITKLPRLTDGCNVQLQIDPVIFT